MARIPLAQQIADLDAPAPVDVDPEAIFSDLHAGSLDVSRAHYVDVGRSTIRKLHDNISDPKYDGVKVSRKQLLEDGSSEEEEEGEDDDESEEEEEEEEASPHQSVRESDEANGDGTEIVAQNNPPDIAITLRKTHDEDRKKGLAVSRQLGIWDALLDTRIRLQKSVVSSNTLPSTQSPQNEPKYQESLDRMLQEAAVFSEQLFELQETLIQVNNSVEPPARKRRKIEIASFSRPDLEAYLDEACEDVSRLEHVYHPHLVQTLTKWSSKIQAVAPSVLLPSNRNAFSNDRQHLKNAVQLVNDHLTAHDKLLGRTQQWRGKGQRLGVEVREEPDHVDTEVFDDTDFYQQLLRDVIDARGTSGANDWMVIQKQKKAKKKVDTKASKGRKLRYDVHEKLLNFMAPVHIKGSWHEEQIDELFSSLLGKGFEDAMNAQVDTDSLTEQTKDLGQLPTGVLEGFRVFG